MVAETPNDFENIYIEKSHLHPYPSCYPHGLPLVINLMSFCYIFYCFFMNICFLFFLCFQKNIVCVCVCSFIHTHTAKYQYMDRLLFPLILWPQSFPHQHIENVLTLIYDITFQHSSMWMTTAAPVPGYVSCFQSTTIMNNAAMNNFGQKSFHVCASSSVE